MAKLKFLLHACCAPCAGTIIQKLKDNNFDVNVFYSNSNIYPQAEYQTRRNEIKKYCQENNINFIENDYNHSVWLAAVKGLESKPEGGKRCQVCYEYRLQETANYARNNQFDIFGTTLSISPHKKAILINQIGENLAQKFNIRFYPADWKKNDGFKKSCELARKHNFYRQNYCGCEFSLPQ